MKITDIECFVLLVPDYRAEACSSAQDDLVVRIHTDEGLVGVGETDTNPWVARAMIEAPGTHIMGLGLKEMLIGADPRDVEGLWERMYTGSAMTGRRGLGSRRRNGSIVRGLAGQCVLGLFRAKRLDRRAGHADARLRDLP